ncbi:hypothetical protein LA345_12955 [Burkholderia vietnamiensis]|uniref:Uncharacterized protein n=1 Tax=Burkholderia vietnamiensis (strain G4 / LMG 22486) TaxID=269482 RepID=A4JFK8_BURVG|nr:hypothetical protein Bcep1808_2059 [Burkholderia vietnamiensis G4]MCB4344821.1 hypothetical protein [Burkholderia vietnamiensis]
MMDLQLATGRSVEGAFNRSFAAINAKVDRIDTKGDRLENKLDRALELLAVVVRQRDESNAQQAEIIANQNATLRKLSNLAAAVDEAREREDARHNERKELDEKREEQAVQRSNKVLDGMKLVRDALENVFQAIKGGPPRHQTSSPAPRERPGAAR